MLICWGDNMVELMEKFGYYMMNMPIGKRVIALGSMFLTLIGVWFMGLLYICGLV